MSRHTQTPAERFTAGMQAFSEDNPQGWLDQCADDVVLEIPFAPPGFPHRVEGKAAVADYLRAVPSRIQFESVAIHDVHQSVDPRTAVIEMTASGHLKDSKARYQMSYIVVIKTDGDRISLYRDYWNPLSAIGLFEDAGQ
jgi:ketosteroid isomerase-like protein